MRPGAANPRRDLGSAGPRRRREEPGAHLRAECAGREPHPPWADAGRTRACRPAPEAPEPRRSCRLGRGTRQRGGDSPCRPLRAATTAAPACQQVAIFSEPPSCTIRASERPPPTATAGVSTKQLPAAGARNRVTIAPATPAVSAPAALVRRCLGRIGQAGPGRNFFPIMLRPVAPELVLPARQCGLRTTESTTVGCGVMGRKLRPRACPLPKDPSGC